MDNKSPERSIIQKLKEVCNRSGFIPGEGIGDDAAFLLTSSLEHNKLVITTDSIVENVHFKQSWSSWSDVATKLFEMNLSDLYVKGAVPHWALLNINCDHNFMNHGIEEFADKLGELFFKFNIALIGGDTTASATNTFSLTMLGVASEYLYRKNNTIEKGDLIVQCGQIGGSNYGMEMLKKEIPISESIKSKYTAPRAQRNIKWLFDLKAKATIDQSDTLFETLEILSKENNIEMEIEIDKINIVPELSINKPPFIPVENYCRQILQSSEDLSIIAILPGQMKEKAEQIKDINIIGKVGNIGKEYLSLVYQDKSMNEIINKNLIFNHFDIF